MMEGVLKIGQARRTLRTQAIAMVKDDSKDIVKAGDFFLYKEDNGVILDFLIYGIIHVDPLDMTETPLGLFRYSQKEIESEVKELEWQTMKPLATVPQNENA